MSSETKVGMSHFDKVELKHFDFPYYFNGKKKKNEQQRKRLQYIWTVFLNKSFFFFPEKNRMYFHNTFSKLVEFQHLPSFIISENPTCSCCRCFKR